MLEREAMRVKGDQPTRREMMALMAAFASVLGAEGLGAAAPAQEPGSGTPAAPGTLDLEHSRVIRFADLKQTPNANGGWGRSVGHGMLPSGEPVELHHSMLPPGKMPHPPHKHTNSEFIVLRQGEVTYLREGGQEVVRVGDVIYTASLKPHGMINQGSEPAIYFVLSIGKANQAALVDLRAV